MNVEARSRRQNVPKFLVGPFRSVLRLALQKIQATELGRRRKLFLLPRTLLFRRPLGGLISREQLTDRFAKFARGEWTELLAWSRACVEEAEVASQRRQRKRTWRERYCCWGRGPAPALGRGCEGRNCTVPVSTVNTVRGANAWPTCPKS